MRHQTDVDEIINQWEFYTLEADGRYHQNDLGLASKGFCRTVELLEPWLDKDHKETKKVIRFFVLSCHNAAHVMSKRGKHREAEYYYSHAHFRLLSMFGQDQKSGSRLDSILLELKCTYLQLQQYLVKKDKRELALSIKDESIRVIRQRYNEYVDDVFVA